MSLVRPEIDAMEDSPILEVWRLGISQPGVIGLWAGEPDSPTPAFISEAAIAALREGHTFYTHNRGIPTLRAALAALSRAALPGRARRRAARHHQLGHERGADHLPGPARRRLDGGRDHPVLAPARDDAARKSIRFLCGARTAAGRSTSRRSRRPACPA